MADVSEAGISWFDQMDTNYLWFAVDNQRCVGAFNAGLGPIHPIARMSESKIDRVTKCLEQRPRLRAGIPDKEYIRQIAPKQSSELRFFRKMLKLDCEVYGERGLYNFMHPRETLDEYEYTDSPYLRSVIPVDCLLLNMLPVEIQQYLSEIRIDVSFSAVSRIPTDMIPDPVYISEKDL